MTWLAMVPRLNPCPHVKSYSHHFLRFIQLAMGRTGDCLAGYEVQTSFLKSLNKKNEEERCFE